QQRFLWRKMTIVEESSNMRQIRKAQVEVCREPRGELFTERQAPLIPDYAVAGAFVTITGGHNKAKARREGRLARPFLQRLVSIIEHHITDPILALSVVHQMG